MINPLLTIENFNLCLKNGSNSYPILHNLSFAIYPSEIVGLIGESGCGKSLTASAI